MNLVFTTFLTSAPHPHTDPPERLEADLGLVAMLRESVVAHGEKLVVLTDSFETQTLDDGTLLVELEGVGNNPFWERWFLLAEAITTAEPEFAWCVDGTDTEMLNNPFPHMGSGVLYVGSEEETYSCISAGSYLRHNSPSRMDYYDAHPHRYVVNPGTIGGDWETLVQVCRLMCDSAECGDASDMGAFQELAWAFGFVTGSQVHTPLRAMQRTGPSWWRHK